MSLHVTELSVRRGLRRVIEDVSLTCETGKALALHGPNGVGKSTLLRAIAGLLPVERGQIALDEAAGGDIEDVQAALSYSGHLDAVKPALSVKANLAVWADLNNSPHLERTLEVFDLKHISDRPAHACSAGQRRRLGLARLMIEARPFVDHG